MAINKLDSFPTDAPLQGQDQATFDANASGTLGYMNTFVTNFNLRTDEINSTSNQINDTANQVAIDADAVATNKNITVSAKDEAIQAKDEIQSYVIPTEATYDPETIVAKVRRAKILNMIGA